MPESAVPDLFRVRIEWTGFLNVSGSLFNILHYKDTAGVSHDYTNQDVADELATAVASFWNTAGTGGAATTRSHYDTGQPATVYARNLNKDNIEASAPTGAGAGSATAQQLPAECSVVCTLGTAIAGKSYRGRVYLPPPSEDVNNVGVVLAAYLTDVKAAFDTWLRSSTGNNLQTADLDLCVYSRKLDVATLVTSTRMNNTFDSQRGRGLR